MQFEPRPDLRGRALPFWKRIAKLESRNFIRPGPATINLTHLSASQLNHPGAKGNSGRPAPGWQRFFKIPSEQRPGTLPVAALPAGNSSNGDHVK
jgi:hypothetical protein